MRLIAREITHCLTKTQETTIGPQERYFSLLFFPKILSTKFDKKVWNKAHSSQIKSLAINKPITKKRSSFNKRKLYELIFWLVKQNEPKSTNIGPKPNSWNKLPALSLSKCSDKKLKKIHVRTSFKWDNQHRQNLNPVSG